MSAEFGELELKLMSRKLRFDENIFGVYLLNRLSSAQVKMTNHSQPIK